MKSDQIELGTRQRLVVAMSNLLQRKGLHGFGLSEVLAQARAPKGVLYHHFPGGKVELAIVAIQSAVNQLVLKLEDLKTANQNPVQVLHTWFSLAQKRLEKSGFEQGCPLAAVALESTGDDQALRQALNEGFGVIRAAITEILVEAGMTTDTATRFSTLIFSAYEGALLQSRIAGSVTPASETIDMLLQLIQGEIETTQGR